MATDDSPQKRKRAVDDIGDRDQKKPHLDDFGVGIGELHVDVGEKYLLCKICKAFPLQPSPLPVDRLVAAMVAVVA